MNLVLLDRQGLKSVVVPDWWSGAIAGFLRNGSTSFGLQGLENKPECFGTPMQIVDDSRAVTHVVG
jgi:hypothetical protein